MNIPKKTDNRVEATTASGPADTASLTRPTTREHLDLGEATPNADEAHSRSLSEAAVAEAPRIESYEFIRKLGEGGHAVVWLARSHELGVPVEVAIKILKGDMHRESDKVSELQNEVMALAKLREDPGVVTIYRADLKSRPAFVVMRYAEGQSLHGLLEERKLTVEEAEKLFRTVCETMAYVHEKGICHCDLKPGNILFEGRGKPLIADFGQAYLKTGSAPLGTWFYMCPEQADPTQAVPDPSWDVYALGAIFYRALCARPPRFEDTLGSELHSQTFLGERLKVYRERLRRAPAPNQHHRVPGMDAELAALIDRCLAVNPAQRFKDAGAIVAALDERARQQRARARRRGRLLLFSGVLAALIVGVAALGVQSYRDLERNLHDRIEKNDRETAKLAANAVRIELDRRIVLVERHARHELLRDLLDVNSPRHQRAVQPIHLLGMELPSAAARSLHSFYRYHWNRDKTNIFDRWFVTNQRGEMLERLAIDPDPKNPDRPMLGWGQEKAEHFRWRGWFNGERDQDPKKPWSHFKPHQQPFYLSEPVESFFGNHQRLVVISVPIYPVAGGEPVGILGASIFCDTHLRKWLISDDGHEVGNFSFALYTNRLSPPRCLIDSSPERTEAAAVNQADQAAFHRYVLDPPRNLVRYRDPADGKEYLGTFELVQQVVTRPDPGLSLTVLIRRDLAEVKQPLHQFALKTLLLGLALLVAVAGSCLLFFRYLQDKRVAHG